MQQKLIERFFKLPLHIKSLFIGLFCVSVGVFLNWFSTQDSFGTAITYTGLNSPLYFMGYTILGVSVYSMIVLLKYLKETDCEYSQLKKYYVEKWSGILVLYLSIAVASVYLHNGIYTSLDKSFGFGFYLTCTGAIIATLGSLLFKRYTVQPSPIVENENQLNLDLDIEEFDFSGHSDRLIQSIISEQNPVYREQIKKQKEIEAKIYKK